MFDLDVGKILVVAVVALVVVGPKDLPRVLMSAARTFGVARRVALQFRRQAMEMINEADLDGVKKEFDGLNRSTVADFAFDPKTAMRGHLPKSDVAPEHASPFAAPATAAAEDATYSSIEMKEYLSESPLPEVGGNANSLSENCVGRSEPAEKSASSEYA